MKYDIASDIHTDLWQGGSASINWAEAKNPDSDLLILAGDTSNYIHELEHVLEQASAVYKTVLFTDGNHEHYFWRGSVDSMENYLSKLSEKFPNVGYLTRGAQFRFGRTVFIGCNGWYDFQVHSPRISVAQARTAWSDGINDAHMIDFDNTDVVMRARRDAKSLSNRVAMLQNKDVDIVVVTHTVPHRILSKWSKYSNTPDAIYDGGFYNTGMEVVVSADTQNKIVAWVYGHTHQRFDKMVGHIRYLNNARGYQREANNMGKWFVAQIDTEDRGYF